MNDITHEVEQVRTVLEGVRCALVNFVEVKYEKT